MGVTIVISWSLSFGKEYSFESRSIRFFSLLKKTVMLDRKSNKNIPKAMYLLFLKFLKFNTPYFIL